MIKKYEFTGEKEGTLKRIRALRNFAGVKAGELGGWIESESNLNHRDNAWVSGNARVRGNARVYEGALVYGNALVRGNARVSGNAWVCDNARVSGNALVRGNARVYGINRSDHYCFVYAPDKDGIFHVMAGCRYFTMTEAREHWANTRGGTPLGDETMCILDAIEALHKVKPEGCV